MNKALRGIIAAGVVAALGMSGTAVAYAMPSPNEGPSMGGTTVTVPAPQFKPVSVETGFGYSMAITGSGDTYAWGENVSGQLGDGTTSERLMPTRVQSPEGVRFKLVSLDSDHSVAVGSDGAVYAWGSNGEGKLGVGDGTNSQRTSPTRVHTPAGVTFTSVAAGGYHSLALASDGNVYAWGRNDEGQLGTGSQVDEFAPVIVQAPAGVRFTAISAGAYHSLAVGNDGNTYAWGDNVDGQLGEGTKTKQQLPTRVLAPAGVSFASVSAGVSHTVAMGNDGHAYAWGRNDSGKLGDGTLTPRSVPTRVVTPTGAAYTSITAGNSHTVAMGNDGNAYAWGQNSSGQLGDGTKTTRYAPTHVVAPSDVSFASVGTSYFHSWALGNDGGLYTWGFNVFGQLGDGGTVSRSTPAMVGAAVSVTGVKFDGLAGSGLQDSGDGTWSVVTPPHVAGAVDVAVEWTLNGVLQPPVVYKAGFAYQSPAPVVAPCSTPRPVAVFEDTPVGHKFYKEIDWMHCMKYSTGWRQPPRKPVYKPADNTSREAMAAFIYRMDAPKNYQAPKVSPFADMKPGDVFYKEISWMYEAKLSTGWAEASGKPTFRPKEKLSREAMAAFIYRMEAPKNYTAPKQSPLADMKPGMSFYKEISWMYDEKLSTGNKTAKGLEYLPKGKLSRQAMAAFIYRLVNEYRA